MAETLAALHSLDPVSLGLEDFGRAGGYCARQVKRWSAQYQQSILVRRWLCLVESRGGLELGCLGPIFKHRPALACTMTSDPPPPARRQPGESALPEMVALSEWLSENIPAADADPSRTRITHGDFRRVDEWTGSDEAGKRGDDILSPLFALPCPGWTIWCWTRRARCWQSWTGSCPPSATPSPTWHTTAWPTTCPR